MLTIVLSGGAYYNFHVGDKIPNLGNEVHSITADMTEREWLEETAKDIIPMEVGQWVIRYEGSAAKEVYQLLLKSSDWGYTVNIEPLLNMALVDALYLFALKVAEERLQFQLAEFKKKIEEIEGGKSK